MHLTKQLPLPNGLHLLDEAVNRGRLSARGVDKVLRIRCTGNERRSNPLLGTKIIEQDGPIRVCRRARHSGRRGIAVTRRLSAQCSCN